MVISVKRVHLVIVHSPQLDLPIIGPTDDQWHAWVEIGPVHPPGVKSVLETEQRQMFDCKQFKECKKRTKQLGHIMRDTCHGLPTHASQQHRLGQRGLGSLVSLVCNGAWNKKASIYIEALPVHSLM